MSVSFTPSNMVTIIVYDLPIIYNSYSTFSYYPTCYILLCITPLKLHHLKKFLFKLVIFYSCFYLIELWSKNHRFFFFGLYSCIMLTVIYYIWLYNTDYDIYISLVSHNILCFLLFLVRNVRLTAAFIF